MTYDELLAIASDTELAIKEKPLRANNGRIKGNRIAIKKDLTSTDKACTLAEELGHYYTSTGDILNQDVVNNRKQELKARTWGYNLLINLNGIVDAYEYGCKNIYEMADYLEVSVEFLKNAIEIYRTKYGIYTQYKCYIIYFVPNLTIIKKIS